MSQWWEELLRKDASKRACPQSCWTQGMEIYCLVLRGWAKYRLTEDGERSVLAKGKNTDANQGLPALWTQREAA